MFVTPQDLGLEPAALPLWCYVAVFVCLPIVFAAFMRRFNRGRY
jgi:hypothetical protein